MGVFLFWFGLVVLTYLRRTGVGGGQARFHEHGQHGRDAVERSVVVHWLGMCVVLGGGRC